MGDGGGMTFISGGVPSVSSSSSSGGSTVIMGFVVSEVPLGWWVSVALRGGSECTGGEGLGGVPCGV